MSRFFGFDLLSQRPDDRPTLQFRLISGEVKSLELLVLVYDKGTLDLAAEKLTLERALSDLFNQANGLTPAENVELVFARF